MGTNYKLEAVETKNYGQPSSFNAQIDSFMNIKSRTFENQMNYLSSRRELWYRQNSRLTIDSPSRMQRLELGDVSYPILGYQQGRLIGGVSFYEDFVLNPYRVTTSTSSFEYEITSRSLVRTIVNGAILKTEYKDSGDYSVKDIPLNNGLNRIEVEITDDFGKNNVLVFNESNSLDSLVPDVSRYSLVAGLPATHTDIKHDYDQTAGTFYSAFYQYGINRTWSLGGYTQGNKKFTILGAINILSTALRNISFDTAGTKNKLQSGHGLQANYQLNLFSNHWYDSHTLNLCFEYLASAYYEKTSDTKRMNVINDDGKKLNSLRTSATVDDNLSSRNGLPDLQYNTTLADKVGYLTSKNGKTTPFLRDVRGNF